MTNEEHHALCDCVDCLKKKVVELKTEKAALHKLLDKRRLETWTAMQPKELLDLWMICRNPSHLETPDDVAMKFGKAICQRISELNWDAFCREGRGHPEQVVLYGINQDDWKDLTAALLKVRDGRGMHLACRPADVFHDWFLALGTAKIKEKT